MYKQLFTLLIALSSLTAFGQNVYSCKSGTISFFSEAPLENIEAKSKNAVAVLNASKNEIVFSVQIKSFQFDKSLMQEHFNENYMESDKFPKAEFKGKFNETVDLSKNGEYKVTCVGKLVVHGVSKERTISGTLKVNNGTVTLISQFDIACKDHDIKIPTVVAQKVAEMVKVSVNADFQSFTVK